MDESTHSQARVEARSLPPLWVKQDNDNGPNPTIEPGLYYTNAYARHRTNSGSSLEYLVPAPITLVDRTAGEEGHADGLWARNVRIPDYVIVSGTHQRSRAGAYVVYNCCMETLEGAEITVRKRYSEFVDLREKLAVTFPRHQAALPVLPPKSVISKFRPQFLEKRRAGLSYFLTCVLLNPEFAGSVIVKEFLLSNVQ